MNDLRSYFWYSLLSLDSCCELVFNVTRDEEENLVINISGIDAFYDEYEERYEKGINTSEESRSSAIRRVLSLCNLMASYKYYPDESFYYMTNDTPSCKLLIHVPSFSYGGSVENITSFIHFAYTAPFYTTSMEDMYLETIGCSKLMVTKLKNRSMGLNELCNVFSVDMSESFMLYRKSSKIFDVYKEDKCIKDLASVLWRSYAANNMIYDDEVYGVSVKRRKVICMNLSRYLIREELVLIKDVEECDQMMIMVLIVVSRDMSCFPDGFK